MNYKFSWSVPWPYFTGPFILTAARADPPLDSKDFRMKREGSSLVPLSVPWPVYSPPDFTAPLVLIAAWADPPLDSKDFRMKREGSS
jgi:hypothetical protein